MNVHHYSLMLWMVQDYILIMHPGWWNRGTASSDLSNSPSNSIPWTHIIHARVIILRKVHPSLDSRRSAWFGGKGHQEDPSVQSPETPLLSPFPPCHPTLNLVLVLVPVPVPPPVTFFSSLHLHTELIVRHNGGIDTNMDIQIIQRFFFPFCNLNVKSYIYSFCPHC